MQPSSSNNHVSSNGQAAPEASQERRAPRIPPHIAWPGSVIGLLLLGMTATFGVLMASQSDGGPSIVENYYAKAVAFDSLSVLHNKVETLGWTIATDLGPADESALRAVRFTVTSADQQPIESLAGVVRAFRPNSVDIVATAPLQATGPGTYEAYLPMMEKGLWDVELEATWTSHTLIHRVRKEVW